jgi:hypothetical protein
VRPFGNFARLIRARVFELLDDAGKVIARFSQNGTTSRNSLTLLDSDGDATGTLSWGDGDTTFSTVEPFGIRDVYNIVDGSAAATLGRGIRGIGTLKPGTPKTCTAGVETLITDQLFFVPRLRYHSVRLVIRAARSVTGTPTGVRFILKQNSSTISDRWVWLEGSFTQIDLEWRYVPSAFSESVDLTVYANPPSYDVDLFMDEGFFELADIGSAPE